MTLIVGSAQSKDTVLVSDRLLTQSGSIVRGAASKAALVVCHDARFALAFAGLASRNVPLNAPQDKPTEKPWQFRTGQWMLEAMLDVAPPEWTLWPMVERFRQAATDRWQQFPRSVKSEDKVTEFILAGHVVDNDGSHSFNVTITNSLNNGRDSDAEFRIEGKIIGERYTVLGGNHHPVTADDIAELTKAAEEEQPANTRIQKAVLAIRRAAQDKRNGIGEECSSITLPRDLSLPVA